MRNRIPWLYGSIVAVGIGAACAPTAQPVDTRAIPVSVRASAAGVPGVVRSHVAGIDINCHGGADKVSITLDKWKVRAGPGDAIRFQMTGNPTTGDYFQIAWKRPDVDWPLDSTLYTIPSGGSRTARVRPGARNGTYAYNISFYCQGNGTVPQVYTGVIDPDIIISGGTTRDTTQY